MNPDIIAAVQLEAHSRTAHHEAGHAVGVVLSGGHVDSIWINDADWNAFPLDADLGKGGTTTYSNVRPEMTPFIAFAGPWAEAKWELENDPDVDSLDEALEHAWEENLDSDGD